MSIVKPVVGKIRHCCVGLCRIRACETFGESCLHEECFEISDAVGILQPIEAIQVKAQFTIAELDQVIAALSAGRGCIDIIETFFRRLSVLFNHLSAVFRCCAYSFENGLSALCFGTVMVIKHFQQFHRHQIGGSQFVLKLLPWICHIGNRGYKDRLAVKIDTHLEREQEEGGKGLQGEQVVSVLGNHGDTVFLQVHVRECSVAFAAVQCAQQKWLPILIGTLKIYKIQVFASVHAAESNIILIGNGPFIEVKDGFIPILPGHG